jgi:hypothetical protein
VRKRITPGTLLGLIAVVFAMTGSAFAANSLLTGKDIKDGSISSRDLSAAVKDKLNKVGEQGDTGPQGPAGANGKDGATVTGPKGETGATGAKGDKGERGEPGVDGVAQQGPAGPEGPKGDKGDTGATGPAGILSPFADTLAAPITIANIGGPINSGYTDLGTGVFLDAGTYLVTVDAAFISDQAGDPAVEVYPQVSLWIDRNHDLKFTWQSEGDISPNAIMPTAANRHISASGITQVTVNADHTYVGLVGFGYTSTQGSERSGQINVVRAVVSALPVVPAATP